VAARPWRFESSLGHQLFCYLRAFAFQFRFNVPKLSPFLPSCVPRTIAASRSEFCKSWRGVPSIDVRVLRGCLPLRLRAELQAFCSSFRTLFGSCPSSWRLRRLDKLPVERIYLLCSLFILQQLGVGYYMPLSFGGSLWHH
jgi:hypothetical protein